MGVLLGAFMAVLDIQITNASLKDIQGTLSASVDDISWVSTACLVAEIIVIPLTGWLSRVFSTRYYLTVNSALFIGFSVLSGLSGTLTMMIVLRALQGFTGGVLIPMAFTVILNQLPKSKQPVGLALFGINATFAPSVGPLIGGWLTDNYGWHSIFHVNIIPGVLLITAVWFALDQEPLQLNDFPGGDWWGVITIAIGLGAMQIVLEEGNRKDWFGSLFIVRLTIVAVVFLLAFLVIEFVRRDPLVNLRLFGRRNFWPRKHSQCRARNELVCLYLHPACLSRPDSRLRRVSDRQNGHVDGTAPVVHHSHGAEAHEAHRFPRVDSVWRCDVRLQLPDDDAHVGTERVRSVPLAPGGARHWVAVHYYSALRGCDRGH